MTVLDMYSLGAGDIRTPHTVEALPRIVRHATGRNEEGKSVFLSTAANDDHHHRDLINKSSIASIKYSTYQHPIELNSDGDIEYVHKNEPETTESACRMVDFAPGGASPMQRVNSMDCAVVLEGVFRMILDSGEERTMYRGDIAVQQSTTAHRWVNVTGEGRLPARILVVPLNSNDPYAGGEKVWGKLGRDPGWVPGRDSVWLSSRGSEDELDSGRFDKFPENDYWESEF